MRILASIRWLLPTALVCILGQKVLAGGASNPSDLGRAFQARFPKSDVNRTALELERLSARIGIDIAPEDVPDPLKPNEAPPSLKDGRARPTGARLELGFGYFLQQELAVPDERIESPSPAIERFLEEHRNEIGAIESVLLGDEMPRWEFDVSEPWKTIASTNVGGLTTLQRLLMTRALVSARGGDTAAAIRSMEASWRLHEAFRSRPDLISQMLSVAVSRFQAGVLRKIDSPAPGWPGRLRRSGSLTSYEAAFQNEAWIAPREPSFQRVAEARARSRYVQSLARRRLCEWSQEAFDQARNEAADSIEDSDQKRTFLELHAPKFADGFRRVRRAAIDAELTALVLDARAQRAALPKPQWPAELKTLNRGVCPEARWSYQARPDSTARFRFESAFEDTDLAPFRLPLEFTAGKPLVRRPSRKGVVVDRQSPPPGR